MARKSSERNNNVTAFSEYERKLLALRVPDLLDEIDADTASDRTLAERGAVIGYGVDGIAKTPDALHPLLQILGAFGPSSTEENLKLISEGART